MLPERTQGQGVTQGCSLTARGGRKVSTPRGSSGSTTLASKPQDSRNACQTSDNVQQDPQLASPQVIDKLAKKRPQNKGKKGQRDKWFHFTRPQTPPSARPRPGKKTRDAFFLLTVEVFLITVCFSYLRWGNRKQKKPDPISGRGEP